MTHRIMTTLSSILLLAVAINAQGSSRDALREDLEFARRKVYPALVNISVVARGYTGGRTARFPAAGSGVIVSPAGHVITNFHVAGESVRITCTLSTGEAIPAEIVAPDPETDICILKLRLSERKDAGAPLPFATLGNSDDLRVGDYVLAVGNPLTLSSSMTLGIVSNTKRVFTDFTGTEITELDLSGHKTGMFTRWIQHDALILPGNSGGPLVNLRGEIVGINTRGGNGVGFASPSNLVSKTLNQVLAHGEVRRGWLGVSIMPTAKTGNDEGALVSWVTPGSPAAEAGIRAGDRLCSLDGDAINVRFFEEVPLLYQKIAEMRPGRDVTALVKREGKQIPVTLHVGRMKKFAGREKEIKDFGLTIQDITEPMALARQYPNRNGILVTGLRPGHAFEEARPKIRAGDIILHINGGQVSDIAGFETAIADAKKQDPEVSISYRRGREYLLTVVNLAREKPKKSGGELPKAWLGIKTQVVTPKVAKAMAVENLKGFRITEVYEWTKAYEGGLRTGDVLVSFDGEELDASRPQDSQDLRNLVEELSIGEKTEVIVARGAERLTMTIELQEKPSSSRDAKKTRDKTLEYTVRDITFMDKVAKYWDRDQKGVLVTEVTSGGWASIGGLRTGDLVVQLGDFHITDTESYDKANKEISTSKPATITIFVRRGYRTSFVFIEPDWSATKKK